MKRIMFLALMAVFSVCFAQNHLTDGQMRTAIMIYETPCKNALIDNLKATLLYGVEPTGDKLFDDISQTTFDKKPFILMNGRNLLFKTSTGQVERLGYSCSIDLNAKEIKILIQGQSVSPHIFNVKEADRRFDAPNIKVNY